MLITCPSCASQYTIDADRVGAGGRTVRCAACRTAWFATADPDPDAASSSDEPLVGEAVTADAWIEETVMEPLSASVEEPDPIVADAQMARAVWASRRGRSETRRSASAARPARPAG